MNDEVHVRPDSRGSVEAARGWVSLIRPTLALVVLVSVVAVSAKPSVAGPDRTITVCPEGCDYRTIQAAASWADAGDTVLVAAGTYRERVEVRRSIVIEGEGEGATIVDGHGTGSTITVLPDADLTLSRLSVTGGTGTERTISGIQGRFGGGIYFVGGTLRLRNVAVHDNHVASLDGATYASAYGGGIFNGSDRTMVIEESVIRDNSADMGGGIAMWIFGELTMTGSTVEANTARSTGGGMLVTDTARLRGCTVAGNQAASYGGGIASRGAEIVVESSTVAGNAAGRIGGGIDVVRSEAAIVSSTVHGNTAGESGGGIAGTDDADDVSVVHTIVAANVGGDCSGGIGSRGHNLASDDTCGLDATGDRSGVDVRLAALDGNGGLTDTLLPERDSPAVDAGSPGGCLDAADSLLTRDQRGAPRPADGDGDGTAVCDIGAVELRALPTTTPTPLPTGTATATATASPTASATPTSIGDAEVVFLPTTLRRAHSRFLGP